LSRDHRWRCLTCGFGWNRDEPPEACPVCGARSDQFVRAEEEKVRLLRDVYDSIRVHPIAVHTPAGALPAAILLLVAGLAAGSESVTRCAYLLLGLVVLALPISFASGVYEWRRRFGGRKVAVFYWKMALSALTLALGIASLVIHFWTRGLEAGTSLAMWIAAISFAAMLPCVVLLGHFGGKLVFEWRKPPKATADTGDGM
jgi:uncharacterized membrane protein